MTTLVDLVLDDARNRFTELMANQGLRPSGDGLMCTERSRRVQTDLDVEWSVVAVHAADLGLLTQWWGRATYRAVGPGAGWDAHGRPDGYEFVAIQGH